MRHEACIAGPGPPFRSKDAGWIRPRLLSDRCMCRGTSVPRRTRLTSSKWMTSWGVLNQRLAIEMRTPSASMSLCGARRCSRKATTMIDHQTRGTVNAQPPVRILIVDDHRANLLALEAVLSPLGHHVLQAQ